MLGHHDLEMADATAHLGDIFGVAFEKGGNIEALSKVLFNSFFFPFEVTSVLLIVAAVAAMVLTRQTGEQPMPRAAATEPDAEEPMQPQVVA